MSTTAYLSVALAALFVGCQDAKPVDNAAATTSLASTCEGIENAQILADCVGLPADPSDGARAGAITAMRAIDSLERTWTIKKSVNPVTDEKSSVAIRIGSKVAGELGSTASLVFRCDSAGLHAFTEWGEYLGDDGAITWRVDSAPPVSAIWNVHEGGTGLFVSSDPRAFLDTLANHRVLRAQVRPYRSSPVRATFRLDGTSDVLRNAMQDCTSSSRVTKP